MANQTTQLYESSLSLRPFDPTTDVDDLMVWMSDDKVSQFCRWNTYTSKDQAITYINDVIINYPYYRAICLDNKAIGGISLDSKTGINKCRAELGYLLGSKYWGRGIATWAVKTVVSTIFEERPELVRVEAHVDVNNIGSQRVLEKVGFLREGVLRKHCIIKEKIQDMIIFSFLSTDVIS
ncbi:putative N-acetyltransferase p20 [Bienertia sinuspersici]